MEREPTPAVSKIAERLNPATMSAEHIQQVAKAIYDMQTRVYQEHPKGKQYLRVLELDEIEQIIKRGDMYYVENANGIEFCCYMQPLGFISAATLYDNSALDTAEDIPVYKAGGIIVPNRQAFLKYADTLSHDDYPNAVIVSRTHQAIGTILNGLGHIPFEAEELRTRHPELYQMYLGNTTQSHREGSKMYVRFPLARSLSETTLHTN